MAHLGAALAVSAGLDGNHRPEQHVEQDEHHQGGELERDGVQREQQQGQPESVPVDAPYMPVAEADQAEQVDGDAADQGEGGDVLERVGRVSDGLLQAERQEDDPGDQQEVDVGVGVAGELVSNLALGRVYSRRAETNATMSK